MSERRPATSIAEIDVHIGYIQQQLRDMSDSLSEMATKTDIDELKQQMSGYATRAELDAARAEWREKSAGSTFDRVTTVITKLGASITVIVAAAYFIVGLLDKHK